MSVPINPVRSLGQTIYLGIVGALVLVLLVFFAWNQVQTWRAGSWKETAKNATAVAEQAQTNANNANGAAANASETRDRIDLHVDLTRADTQDSAGRIEKHETTDLVPAGAPDDDVLLEVDAGEAKYRAAANRLQRIRASGAGAKRTND